MENDERDTHAGMLLNLSMQHWGGLFVWAAVANGTGLALTITTAINSNINNVTGDLVTYVAQAFLLGLGFAVVARFLFGHAILRLTLSKERARKSLPASIEPGVWCVIWLGLSMLVFFGASIAATSFLTIPGVLPPR